MSRSEKDHRHVLGALALAAMLAIVGAACGGGPRPESSPAPVEPAPAPAAPATPAAPAAPAAPPEPELEPSAEQLPLADDFSDQVEGEITAANYRSQLDALEREILAETGHK